jgi:hypothetical protein
MLSRKAVGVVKAPHTRLLRVQRTADLHSLIAKANRAAALPHLLSCA